MKNYITFNKLQYAEKFNEKINTETSLNHETKKDFNKERSLRKILFIYRSWEL